MELKISVEKIKTGRASKAWSQEHLAHVSGLGLRTIQRIETTGLGSYESVRAISSSLDLPISELVVSKVEISTSGKSSLFRNKRLAVAVAFLISMSALLLVRGVAADQVSLDLGVIVNEQNIAQSRLVTEEGQEALLQIDKEYQIAISPTLAGNNEFHLQVRVMRFDGENYIAIARPRLVTQSNQEIQIESKDDSYGSITLKIKPRLN